MKKKRVTLLGDQARFSKDFSSRKIDLTGKARQAEKSEIRVISSAPGSGKTTLIEETLLTFVDENEEVADQMIENGQKILIIVFNKINKKELETRFKKAELPMDLFEISTVNSLFFRHAKELTTEKTISSSMIGGFSIDYTASTFSKEKIKTILSTFVKDMTFEDVSVDAEMKLKKARAFSMAITEDKFVSTVWSLVNGFFSSAYSLDEVEKIEKEAKFFGKKEVSFSDLDFSEEDAELLRKSLSRSSAEKTISELFIDGVVKRIHFLANFKEVELIKQEATRYTDVPVYTENRYPIDENPSFEEDNDDLEAQNLDFGNKEENLSIQQMDIKEVSKNIFLVPHAYYFKTLLVELLQNRDLTEKLFKKYVRIIGDEFQDNTFSLLKFLLYLLDHKIVTDLSMVGDSDQRIYGFSSSDNFDLLKYCSENKEVLEKRGMKVSEYCLNQTHRFGEQIAAFTNDSFNDSNIIGRKDIEDFVYPETIKKDNFVETIKKAAKRGSSMVICRSNNEAAELFVRLKEGGIDNVRLETTAKKEISDFVRKGPEALSDKTQKEILQKMLDRFDRENPNFQPVKGDTFPIYEKILADEKIKSFLRKSGQHQLIRYELDQVEKYMLPAQKRKSKFQVIIGTPYPLKGMEADAVFIGSFFEKQLERVLKGGGEEEDQIIDLEEEYADILTDEPKIDIGGLTQALANLKASRGITVEKEETSVEERKESQDPVEIKPVEIKPVEIIETNATKSGENMAKALSRGTGKILRGLYEEEEAQQEKAVLFVAVTRAKKGVFFEDSLFGRAMLDNFNLNVELNRKRGEEYLTDPDKKNIESLIKKEKGLFDNEVEIEKVSKIS